VKVFGRKVDVAKCFQNSILTSMQKTKSPQMYNCPNCQEGKEEKKLQVFG
jgi:hypothetical protein